MFLFLCSVEYQLMQRVFRLFAVSGPKILWYWRFGAAEVVCLAGTEMLVSTSSNHHLKNIKNQKSTSIYSNRSDSLLISLLSWLAYTL